jgi:hypothetical protein
VVSLKFLDYFFGTCGLVGCAVQVLTLHYFLRGVVVARMGRVMGIGRLTGYSEGGRTSRGAWCGPKMSARKE